MAYFLAQDNVASWLKALSSHYEVYAPRREGPSVVYRTIQGSQEGPELTIRPTESAKHVLFPRAEELFHFHRTKVEGGSGTAVSVGEPAAPAPALVFGALPCDARGFFAFDPVYNGSGTQGQAKDVYYLKRRANTVFVVKGCTAPLATCFCNWVGGSPTSEDGADVFAIPVAGGFVLDAVTDKGRAALAVSPLPEADTAQQNAATEAAKTANASMPQAPSLDTAQKAVIARFDDAAFWQKQSAACLSCGACSYLCPTCYCFNITDETNGVSGIRLRSWDTCMSSNFTLEASGHNPRVNKAARLKNRVGHKFSYYPGLHEGRISCVGCGRCIKSCPSLVDIRAIVKAAIAAQTEKEEVARG